MIPMMMTLAVRHDGVDRYTGQVRPEGDGLRLWLPLFLLWILVAPFALLLSPLLLIGMAYLRLNPFRASAALFGLLCAFAGTRIEVESPGASVNIRIF